VQDANGASCRLGMAHAGFGGSHVQARCAALQHGGRSADLNRIACAEVVAYAQCVSHGAHIAIFADSTKSTKCQMVCTHFVQLVIHRATSSHA